MQKRRSARALLFVYISVGLVAACSAADTDDTGDSPSAGAAGSGAAGSGAAGRGADGRAGSGGTSAGRGGGGGTKVVDAGRDAANGKDAGSAGGFDAASDAAVSDGAGDEAIGKPGSDSGGVDVGISEAGAIDARSADADARRPSDAESDGASDGSGGTTNGCPAKIEGWATLNADSVNGTTGGGHAPPTTVTTFAELKEAAQAKEARVIVVSGTIKTTDGGGSALQVASNKTIVGSDKSATIYGGLTFNGVSNVIVRNLNIHGVWPNSGPDDTLASHGSHHIWWDHLNVWDAGDGALDITNQSSYQTVSWCKFWYTSKDHPHRLASLNGSGGGDHPEDAGYLKVTYHHNWWSTLVNERMPRVMYGQGHQYNNYFNSPGNLYCVGVGSYGAILVENNYFKDVKGPHVFMYTLPMSITARGNVYDNTTGNRDNGAGGAGAAVTPFTDPPYDYTLDKATDVPALVQKCAGPQ